MDESTLPERKLEEERHRNSHWILIIAVLACIFSFIPVYYIGSNSQQNGWSTYISYTNDPLLQKASISALFLVLCPAIDSFLEMVPLYPLRVEDTATRRMLIRGNASHAMLTHAEKFMFILSIICLSVLSYYPTIQNFDNPGHGVDPSSIARACGIFLNCSTTLQVCAILSFLVQQSSTFSVWKWNSRCICFLVCSSGIIGSSALLYDPGSPYAMVLFMVAAIVFDVAALMYTVTCSIALIQFIFRKYGIGGARGNKVVDANNGQEDKAQSKEEIAEEDFKHFIIGMHMFSTFVIMILNSFWVWFNLTPFQLSVMIYITLAAAIVIFVTENLARRYVTVSALHALLDSKKNYVRYISHEIRTPLSATLMGLRLLVNDFKNTMPKKGTIDHERLDTLQDVHSSCVAALDILNDLLCFNKLESGILELHQESVPVYVFIKESVAMFNVQARDCGVILRVIFDKPPSDDIEGESHMGDENSSGIARNLHRIRGNVLGMNILSNRPGSVQAYTPRDVQGSNASANRSRRVSGGHHRGGPFAGGGPSSVLSENVDFVRAIDEFDTISLDKFKMDQVIRNLVSNAIKFSPEGQVVTINAYFEPIPLVTKKKRHSVSSVVKKEEKPIKSAASGAGSTSGLRNNLSHLFSGRFMIPSPDNASVATPPPVNTPCRSGRLVVTVTDHGPGISAENQKRLFKEVIQFNPEKLQAGGGSGFGLFISKSIVDLHEGTIGVYSAGEGKGTRFTLELPMFRSKRIPRPMSERDVSHYVGHDLDQSVGSRSMSIVPRIDMLQITTPSQPQQQQQQQQQQQEIAFDGLSSRSPGNKDIRPPESVNTTNNVNINGNVNVNGCEDFKKMEECDRVVAGSSPVSVPAAATASASARFVPSRSASQGQGKGKGTAMLRELSLRQTTALVNSSFRVQGQGQGQGQDVVNRKWDLLIVDDSPLNRKMLMKTMRANKHTCEEAKDGQEALDAVIKRIDNKEMKPYDAILMDFVMPVMDGPTATKKIRELAYTGVVIGLTGNAMPSDIAHFMEQGASAVLIKPIDMIEFDATMKRLLQS